jgi:hypothetical protein
VCVIVCLCVCLCVASMCQGSKPNIRKGKARNLFHDQIRLFSNAGLTIDVMMVRLARPFKGSQADVPMCVPTPPAEELSVCKLSDPVLKKTHARQIQTKS